MHHLAKEIAMTLTAGSPPETTAESAASLPIVTTAGRHIENWNPEDDAQWEGGGKVIAKRNLRWSIFAEFLGFVVWQSSGASLSFNFPRPASISTSPRRSG